MILTKLFACHFRGGVPSEKLRMVEIRAVRAPSPGGPQMPHFLWSKKELEPRFPSVEGVEAAGAHDPQALAEDAVLK